MFISDSELLSRTIMTFCEEREMEREGLNSNSNGTLSTSKKFIPTSSSLSVIYAPFTYPLSSLMLIPPLNSLVNIKDQASYLAHPFAKLGHASQIFSSAKMEPLPSSQEASAVAETLSSDEDQVWPAYSLKESLKPPVGAVVDSLITIRTDIVDKVNFDRKVQPRIIHYLQVSNLRTGVEDRVNAAKEKVPTTHDFLNLKGKAPH